MPVLYIVATPIGNLEDISLRALRVLREAKLIAAEDTRKTRRLLGAHDIRTPMTSYYEHNKLTKLDHILAALDEGDVALVSEAGMPGISDPGYELIAAAHERGVAVVPVPGPSAVITAMAVSGLPTDRFVYIGFLPGRAAARRRALDSVAAEPGSIVLLEAPHRLPAALADILQVLGDRRLAVCRVAVLPRDGRRPDRQRQELCSQRWQRWVRKPDCGYPRTVWGPLPHWVRLPEPV